MSNYASLCQASSHLLGLHIERLAWPQKPMPGLCGLYCTAGYRLRGRAQLPELEAAVSLVYWYWCCVFSVTWKQLASQHLVFSLKAAALQTDLRPLRRLVSRHVSRKHGRGVWRARGSASFGLRFSRRIVLRVFVISMSNSLRIHMPAIGLPHSAIVMFEFFLQG